MKINVLYQWKIIFFNSKVLLKELALDSKVEDSSHDFDKIYY